MKTRGGWRETPQSHEVAFSRNLSDLTDEELMAIIDAPQAPRLLPAPCHHREQCEFREARQTTFLNRTFCPA
jgi:hypothetical protein